MDAVDCISVGCYDAARRTDTFKRRIFGITHHPPDSVNVAKGSIRNHRNCPRVLQRTGVASHNGAVDGIAHQTARIVPTSDDDLRVAVRDAATTGVADQAADIVIPLHRHVGNIIARRTGTDMGQVDKTKLVVADESTGILARRKSSILHRDVVDIGVLNVSKVSAGILVFVPTDQATSFVLPIDSGIAHIAAVNISVAVKTDQPPGAPKIGAY